MKMEYCMFARLKWMISSHSYILLFVIEAGELCLASIVNLFGSIALWVLAPPIVDLLIWYVNCPAFDKIQIC
jgi:hypothetical protein